MKALYRGALVLWLVSGFAIHAYFSRAAQGTVAVEQNRDLHLRQFENNDAVAREIREARGDADAKMILAYASWGFVGFLLALRGVHLLFRKADHVADIEKYLAASLLLLLSTGCMRQPFEPVKLETIGPNEEGFLIPYTGDARKQTSTDNEEFFRAGAPGVWLAHDPVGGRSPLLYKIRSDPMQEAALYKIRSDYVGGRRLLPSPEATHAFGAPGTAGNTPDLLLQMPAGPIETTHK